MNSKEKVIHCAKITDKVTNLIEKEYDKIGQTVNRDYLFESIFTTLSFLHTEEKEGPQVLTENETV